MTQATEEVITSPVDYPIWRLAIAGFIPEHRREWAQRWINFIPLGLILLAQVIMSLRLMNTGFEDESLYVTTGHWIRSSWATGVPLGTNPATYFSGAPQLYPVFASYLDSIGGLQLVRAFSLICMLSSTIAIYWTARVLFPVRSMRVGLFAAVVFVASAPVIFLGNFATFDAVSFTCIAWAMAIGVWASVRNKALAWSFLVGGLCALATMLKYSSAIDVPFVMLLTLVGFQNRGQNPWRVIVRGVLAGAVCLEILITSATTWGKADLKGLTRTTTSRQSSDHETIQFLSERVLVWTGITLVLMLAGGVWLFLRGHRILAPVMVAGTLAATAYQIHTGELISLHKHIVLGLIFGAPLAGALLSDLSRKLVGTIAVTVVVWVALMFSLSQSHALYSEWPNTNGLNQTISYSIKQFPTIRMAGDAPEPEEYAFRYDTQPWQWTSTFDGAFSYKGLNDLPAFELALKDNYFQLVFLDRSTPISAALQDEMGKFGFKLTDTIKGPHTWWVYQRFDGPIS